MTFNLDDYEPVAVRLARFLEFWTTGDMQPIVETEMVHYSDQRVVFRAKIGFINVSGERVWLATGFEEETRGEGHVNRTSHLANCETSAIGRALANYGYAGSDPNKRPSREEMSKVQRAATPADQTNEPRKFPNKFPKPCFKCGIRVGEQQGWSWKQGETYVTCHKDGECETEPPF
jgi:hypothetical protein